MQLLNSLILIFLFGSYLSVNAQAPSISLQPFASGFVRPVVIENCKDERLFVVEQDGYINVVNANGSVLPTPFLNIDPIVNSNSNEQGLLGLAFHPDYKTNGYFYVYYTNSANNIVISRFNVSATDSNLANASSEQILITILHPTNTNHNGGCLRFGPDGYLYAGTGDGGGGGDVANNAQNKNKLLGKMIRLDINNGSPYSVPADNPFVNTPNTQPEIWAYGLRNPWRWSFDRLTGDLWIGDVGQNAWEEVDFQKSGIAGGQNYGWRCYEGNHGYNTSGCQPQTAYIPAVYEMSHSGNYCSVVGGYVYRGGKYSNMFGYYFFADYCVNMIQVLKRSNTGTYVHYNTINYSGANISTFGEDQYGELYVADLTSGQVRKIVSTVCAPTAYISASDTLIVCADSVELSTPYGDSLFYSWQTPSGTGNANSIWVNQSGWSNVNVINLAACQNSDSVYVLINGVPPVASIAGLDTAYCSNLSPADSLVGSPSGGVFSGPGITGNVFYADSAGAGIHQISYLFTDPNGCSSSSSQVVTVSLCTGIDQTASSVFTIRGANPASGHLDLSLESSYSGVVQSSVTDVSGRNISTGMLTLEKGQQSIHLPMEKSENGIYFWHLSNGESAITYRFIWVK